jgi:hypothetical protein
MNVVLITTAKILPNSAVVLMARIVGANGVPIVQSDVTSITVKVYDSTGTQVGSTLTPAVSTVVYNTPLVADPRWEDETQQPNFMLNLVGTYFPLAAKTYQVLIRFTPATGDPFSVDYSLSTANVVP